MVDCPPGLGLPGRRLWRQRSVSAEMRQSIATGVQYPRIGERPLVDARRREIASASDGPAEC
jgi:hypothetical protein